MPAAGGQDDTRDPASAVLDGLAQAFGVVTERDAPGGGTRQRTWLDTFDWRLNKAGLVLEYSRAKRGGRLLLSRDDLPQAEQRITGLQPRRPLLAEELPAGPVRDQILKLVSPRALLPVARATSTVSVTRLLNADGKTEARLIVERSTASQGDVNPHTAELPPRLAIAEVRGYPGQARKAARLLAGVPGVSAASEPVFDAALRALGRHPGDYSSGVDAEITAQMPASVAVATVLLRLLDTLELNLDGVLRDIDTEFLHDLRVSVRRTRSAIKLLGTVLPDGLAGPYAAEFKWLRRPDHADQGPRRPPARFRKIVAKGSAITPDSPPESLHDLRKRAKELRYLLEFFAPLHDPAAYKKVVGDLKQLQDCLGEFQDSQVQREEIHALADAMLAERAAPAATLQAMSEIAANLAISQAEAREDFAMRFARFAGPARKQRIRTLLAEPADPEPGRRVKTYATYNIKGGVGKTTAAVNLAYLSAADGCRTCTRRARPASCSGSSPGSRAAGRRSSAAPRPWTTRSRAPTSRTWTCSRPTSPTATWTCSSTLLIRTRPTRSPPASSPSCSGRQETK